jgi:hypothetical protein
MSRKSLVMLGMIIGSSVGGYAPALFGADPLASMWGVVGTGVGGFLGIWLAYKISS